VVGVKKLVFSSTAALFGEPESVPIAEDAAHTPTNVYGETKLAIERMIRATCTAHGMRAVCLRYFNAAGAHKSAEIGEDHRPESHLIP
jgi:UDP-glucose 4-epimerase